MNMSVRFPNLGIDFSYIGRSVNVFGFEITYYGMLIALGMLLGLLLIVLDVKRQHENLNLYIKMLIVSIIGAIVGARLLYVIFYWNLFDGNIQSLFQIRNGGLSFYGALFGGCLTARVYCACKKTSFWKKADSVSIGLTVGQIIGRWGDFFNRESFGQYTETIFAMRLPLASVRSSEVTSVMREKLAVIDGVSYIQAHPIFLYESIWCLVLLLILLWYKRRKKFHGEIFMRYLSGYGLGKFFLEWLKTEKVFFPGTKISFSMLISAILFVIFGLTAVLERSVAKKREKIRKSRREAFYAREQEAARKSEDSDQIFEMEIESEDSKQERLAEEYESQSEIG